MHVFIQRKYVLHTTFTFCTIESFVAFHAVIPGIVVCMEGKTTIVFVLLMYNSIIIVHNLHVMDIIKYFHAWLLF